MFSLLAETGDQNKGRMNHEKIAKQNVSKRLVNLTPLCQPYLFLNTEGKVSGEVRFFG